MRKKEKRPPWLGRFSLCSVAVDWSQGPKRNVVTVAKQPLKTVGRFFFLSHAPDRSGYFLVVFLVVFLAAFFFAMALVTSFQETNVRTAKL